MSSPKKAELEASSVQMISPSKEKPPSGIRCQDGQFGHRPLLSSAAVAEPYKLVLPFLNFLSEKVAKKKIAVCLISTVGIQLMARTV